MDAAFAAHIVSKNTWIKHVIIKLPGNNNTKTSIVFEAQAEK